MAACDVCGNEYDKPISLTHRGTTGTFDSFECAISAMAPLCGHCQCRILGHGVESGDQMYCCAHCARQSGHPQATDRVG